tara:strand:+ start:506 stop:1057 length:552 start_codon:yes stop_codon:yes gene_type:complete
MKKASLVVFVIVLFINPVVDAHGANTFQFIMRNGSIQPDDAQVTQNDSLIFNNVVMDLNRTVELENPKNSTHNWSCTAKPYNSTGIDDECQLWLDPLNWSAGNYQALVYSNGSLWHTVNFTIILDIHNETTPNFVLPSGNSRNEDSQSSDTNLQFLWIGLALFCLAAISRTVKKGRPIGDEEE